MYVALVERKVIMEDEGEVSVIIYQPASPLPVPFERLIRHLLGAIERVASSTAFMPSQFLYLCTSKASKLRLPRPYHLLEELVLRLTQQYVSICTFVPVKQVN